MTPLLDLSSGDTDRSRLSAGTCFRIGFWFGLGFAAAIAVAIPVVIAGIMTGSML